MDESNLNGRPETPRSLPRVAPILLAGLVIVVLVAVGLVYRFRGERPVAPAADPASTPQATEPWPTIPPTRTPRQAAAPDPTRTPLPTATALPTATQIPTPTWTPTPTPRPVQVSDVRRILELNMVEFRSTTVVDRQRSRWWGTDWVMIQAVGQVRVGIDLDQSLASTIETQGNNLRMVLPHARVLSVELLPGESEIYEVKRRIIFSEYPGLELEAMEAARIAIGEAAEENVGILDLAEKSAALELAGFFERLWYSDVEIVFQGDGE